MINEKVVCINSYQIPDLQCGTVYTSVSFEGAFIKLEGIKGSFANSRFCIIDESPIIDGDMVVATDLAPHPLSNGGFYVVNQVTDEGLYLRGYVNRFNKKSFVKIKQNESSSVKIKIDIETINEIYSNLKHSTNDGIELNIVGGKLCSYGTYKNPKTNNIYNAGDIVVLKSSEEMVVINKTDTNIVGTIITGFNKGDQRSFLLSGTQIQRLV